MQRGYCRPVDRLTVFDWGEGRGARGERREARGEGREASGEGREARGGRRYRVGTSREAGNHLDSLYELEVEISKNFRSAKSIT